MNETDFINIVVHHKQHNHSELTNKLINAAVFAYCKTTCHCSREDCVYGCNTMDEFKNNFIIQLREIEY